VTGPRIHGRYFYILMFQELKYKNKKYFPLNPLKPMFNED